MSERQDRTEKVRGTRGLGRVFARRHGPPPKPDEQDTRPECWWVSYYVNGREVRESAHSSKRKAATDLLKKRLGEIGNGAYIGPKAERVVFEDLAAMLVADYEVHGRVSLDTAKRSLVHLRESFGPYRAVNITRDRVDGYIAARIKAGAARATVQKEIAALSRAFALAVRAGRLVVAPRFTRLKVENTRTESFTDAELDAVLDVMMHGRPATAKDPEVEAQPDLVPPIVFAAVTGWRMKSDVLPLTWRQVDLAAGTVTRWSRGTSKAPEHCVFPFDAVPDLAALLGRQREATTALERETGSIVPFVFHRRGRRIKSMHAAWQAACRRAGVPGRRPHDLRRTGARALRAFGMSDRDIAELCGWKTQDMVSRYLGRDPAGVADRLRRKVAESGARTRTFRGRSAVAGGMGEK